MSFGCSSPKNVRKSSMIATTREHGETETTPQVEGHTEKCNVSTIQEHVFYERHAFPDENDVRPDKLSPRDGDYQLSLSPDKGDSISVSSSTTPAGDENQDDIMIPNMQKDVNGTFETPKEIQEGESLCVKQFSPLQLPLSPEKEDLLCLSSSDGILENVKTPNDSTDISDVSAGTPERIQDDDLKEEGQGISMNPLQLPSSPDKEDSISITSSTGRASDENLDNAITPDYQNDSSSKEASKEIKDGNPNEEQQSSVMIVKMTATTPLEEDVSGDNCEKRGEVKKVRSVCEHSEEEKHRSDEPEENADFLLDLETVSGMTSSTTDNDRTDDIQKATQIFCRKGIFLRSISSRLNDDDNDALSPAGRTTIKQPIPQFEPNDKSSQPKNYGNYHIHDRTHIEDLSNNIVLTSDEDLAVAYNNIGNIHLTNKNFTEAVQCYTTSLKLKETTLGHDCEESIGTLQNLGTAHFQMGMHKCAFGYYKRALELVGNTASSPSSATGDDVVIERYFPSSAERECGAGNCADNEDQKKNYLTRATLHNKIGNVHSARKEFCMAMGHYKISLNIKLEVFGDLNHEEVLLILHNIALVHCKKGNLQKAKTIMKDIYRRKLETFGPDHPHVAKSLLDVATIRLRKGEIRAANDLVELAGEKFQLAGLSCDHPYVRQAEGLLGKVKREKRLSFKMFPLKEND